MFESKAGVLLIAGLGFFFFAFLSNAVVPVIMYKDLPEQKVLEQITVEKPDAEVDKDGNWLMTVKKPKGYKGEPLAIEVDKQGNWRLHLARPELEAAEGQEKPKEPKPPAGVTVDKDGLWWLAVEKPAGLQVEPEFALDDEGNWQVKIPKPSDAKVAKDGNWNVPVGIVPSNKRIMKQMEDIARRFKEPFKESFGEVTYESCAEALRLGRQVYIGEGCWHCHSQFIRPVSNESRRWGQVSQTREYQNELQRPVMFGTRRVGPDLSREGGRHGNDWHAVHFFRPKTVSPNSPMPEYAWFFNGAPDKPNKRGLAIILYVQWLGSWLDSYPYYEELDAMKSEEL